MGRVIVVTTAIVCATAVLLSAQSARGGNRVTNRADCAASLGTGVKSKRTFCDLIIASSSAESVSMTIPARTGAATLYFDLHNRFDVPAVAGYPGASYARHEAVVRIIQPDGEVIGRAAVVRDFRSAADLFDQLSDGGRPGGVKAVAPGPPEAVRFAIPAGITAVGIVGERLRVRTAVGGEEVFDAPGRPVAIASNIRLEYRPR